jgi:hypothetical protein
MKAMMMYVLLYSPRIKRKQARMRRELVDEEDKQQTLWTWQARHCLYLQKLSFVLAYFACRQIG